MQDASLNRGMWLRLENLERKKALKADSVHVYIKLEFSDSTVVDGVRVPTGFLKTLIVDGIEESYYFPNSNPGSKNLEHFLIPGEKGK
jgi:DNA/RNA endonuclease G (NUC1)